MFDDEDDGTLRLHVSNIPFTWSKEKLADVFGQYGTTFDVEVVYNERGSKGFGFVTFLAKKDALEAKRRMDREIVDGRRLVVNFAKPKQKTSGSKDPHPSSGSNTHHAWKPNSYSDRSHRVTGAHQQPLGFSTPPTARRQHLSGFSSLSSTPTRATSTTNHHRYYL
jgi:RNA recognition motif-containing protein